VKAINELIEGSEGKRWMQRYIATDNHPVSSPHRKGKRRPRVDIEIVQLQGSRPRFHFESKRLGKRPHTVDKYLGKDGLGCFLEAQYARESDQGGDAWIYPGRQLRRVGESDQEVTLEKPSGIQDASLDELGTLSNHRGTAIHLSDTTRPSLSSSSDLGIPYPPIVPRPSLVLAD
jgi:hypothetical protein